MNNYLLMASYILEASTKFAPSDSVSELTFYDIIDKKFKALISDAEKDDVPSLIESVAKILENTEGEDLYRKTINFIHELFCLVKNYPENYTTNPIPNASTEEEDYYINILYEAKMTIMGNSDTD